MNTQTKYLSAQELLESSGKRTNSDAIGGMSIRLNGGDMQLLMQYHNRGDLLPYYEYADRLINEGKIFYTHPFPCKCGAHRFQYGGGWACNTCGNCPPAPEWWKVRVFKDGDAWCVAGDGFVDLQQSENYAFGNTKEEALNAYLKLHQN